jgi:UDP-hydrolysing UDP-N-acetyl-D-glucosamine 2-epimerase
MTIKIAFLTGSRSEWGYIRPILRQVEQDSDLEYALIVTNMHLSPTFGSSIQEIERDQFRIAARLDVLTDTYTGASMVTSLASLLGELPAVLQESAPDVLLLAGDRGEQLMGAIAAVHMGIPVAHVQSGELSGNVDGLVRHAITKLAHLHFTANEEFAERVRRLGEDDFRIHVTGAPLTDELTEGLYDAPERVVERLGLNASEPLMIAIQHPVTEEEHAAGEQIEETLAALHDIDVQTILVAPNSDAGSLAIRERIARLNCGNIRVVKNLPRKEYLALLKTAAAIVGNSSSGIMEAPTFGTPCVNIGRRQHGRLQSTNVINVGYCREAIAGAIRTALSAGFSATARKSANPYGSGGAAARIVQVLKRIDRSDCLLNKELTY